MGDRAALLQSVEYVAVGSGRPRGRLNGVDVKPEVLRHARRRSGLSLAQVAGSELTRQAVHLIETGKVRPSMNSLRVITSRLAVPLHSVLVQPGAAYKRDGHVGELEQLVQGMHYDRALEHGGEILKRADSPPVVALVHHYVGHTLIYLGRPLEALKRLKLARELFESIGDGGFVVETMELQAKALHMAEDTEALEVAVQALELCRTLDPAKPETESRILERLGTILVGRGDFVGARTRYEAALGAAGAVRDLAQMARIYHGLGLCYLKVGDLARAVDLVLKAETLYEAQQRISEAPPSIDLPKVENDLGHLLMEQGDLGRAEQRLQSALRSFTELGVERFRSYVLLSLGELRYRQGRYDEGLELAEEAVVLAQRFNERRTLAAGCKQLGELRAARGDLDQAVRDFKRALTILEEAGLEERRAACLKAYERALAKRYRADAADSA